MADSMPTSIPNYTIRTMSRAEVDLAIEWAAAEGWNPGLQDAESFYAADPDGFLVGELSRTEQADTGRSDAGRADAESADGDRTPKPTAIATISAVRYGETFGFLGFYIVQPAYRGQGYGMALWQAALQRLAGRTIGLDGVVAQQDNYQKSGFQRAYGNIRYAGVSGTPAADSAATLDATLLDATLLDATLIDLAQVPFEAIVQYDQPFFPADRVTFLKAWLQQPASWTLGILQNGTLAGYGVIRGCRSGYKIGPLFADSVALAEALFLALQAKVPPGQTIYLDTPELNSAAIALAEKYQMQVVFETARMYSGPHPALPFDRLFGVTSFELG
jgi:ribosomal protein S18 acetylase RimI-like enzyme